MMADYLFEVKVLLCILYLNYYYCDNLTIKITYNSRDLFLFLSLILGINFS